MNGRGRQPQPYRRGYIAPHVSAGVLLLCFVLPLAAQSGFSAAYDATQRVRLKGIVTRIEWANPHAYVFMNAEDETAATKQNPRNTRILGKSGPPPELPVRIDSSSGLVVRTSVGKG